MSNGFDIVKYMESKHRRDNSNQYNYFPVDEEQRQRTLETYVKVYTQTVMDHWDVISKYVEFDSPETLIKYYKVIDYNRLWDTLRRYNVNLNKSSKQEKKDDYESIFGKFIDDELKLMCDDDMINVIKFFKSYRKSHKQRTQALPYNETSENYEKLRFSLGIQHDTAKLDLSHDKPYEKEEKEELEAKLNGTAFLLKLLDKPDDNPNLVKFILDNLQYAPVSELTKLLEMIDNGFIKKIAGRRPKDIPIYVFNEFGKLIKQYKNRAECMDEEAIGKQYLQQLLCGKKRRQKCWYVEMTEEQFREKATIIESSIIDKANFVKKS